MSRVLRLHVPPTDLQGCQNLGGFSTKPVSYHDQSLEPDMISSANSNSYRSFYILTVFAIVCALGTISLKTSLGSKDTVIYSGVPRYLGIFLSNHRSK